MKRTGSVCAILCLPALAWAVLPAVPTGVGVTNLNTGGKLLLSWNANTDIPPTGGYLIYRSTYSTLTSSPSVVFLTSKAASQTTHLDAGLSNGTTYYYRLRAAENYYYYSDLSAERKGVPTSPPPPSAPNVLGISNPGTGPVLRLLLSWMANTESNISSYTIDRGTVTNFETNAPPPTFVGSTGHPPPPSTQDAGLLSGTRYFYHVHAWDNSTPSQMSPPSGELSEVALDLPPSAARSFVADDFDPLTATALRLLWSPNTESDMSNYLIYRATMPSGPETLLTTVVHPGNNFLDSGLTPNRPYRYAIYARDTAPLSAPRVEAIGVPGLPSTPSNLGVTDAGTSGRLNLSWIGSPEADVAQYRIWRSLSSGPLSRKSVVNVVLAPGTTFQDRGLANGIPQFYQVTARDSSLNESVSATAEASATPSLAESGAEKLAVTVDVPGVGQTQLDVPKNDIRIITETRPDVPLGIVSSEANQKIVTAVANTQGGEFTFRVFTLAGELVKEIIETRDPLTSFSFVPQDLGSGVYIIEVEGPGMKKVSKKVAIGR